MLMAIGILLIASIFELRFLFRQNEKKEAAIYLCIIVFTTGLSICLMLTPQFYSFAKMMNSLFGAR